MQHAEQDEGEADDGGTGGAVQHGPGDSQRGGGEQAGGAGGEAEQGVMDEGDAADPLIDRTQRDDDDDRRREQAGDGDHRPLRAALAGAEGGGEVDHVRAGQELAEAEQVGELGPGEPAAALDHDAAGEGQHAAETRQAGREEAGEEFGKAGAGRLGVHRRYYAPGGMIDKPAALRQFAQMSDDGSDDRNLLEDDLALRAGPAKNSPPLPVALMILLLGLAAPFVFVHTARPSPFLTAMALLLPLSGTIAVIGSVESMRRRHGDRAVRTRAVIGADGVALLRRPAETEHHVWADIAAAEVTPTTLTLQVRGEDGKRLRRAIRYAGLETPVEMLRGRIAQGLKNGAAVTKGDRLS